MKHAYFSFLLLALGLGAAPAAVAQALVVTSAISFNPNGLQADVTGRAIAVDAAGNQVIAGFFVGKMQLGSTILASTDTAAYVAKRIGSTGAWLWATKVSGSGRSVAYGVGVDAAGNAFVTGRFANTVSFATSAAGAVPSTTTTLTSAGYKDVFVARFAANTGACRWAVAAGGSGPDASTRLAVDGAGNAYVVGLFNGTAAFGTSAPGTVPATSTSLTSAGGVGVFVARFDGGSGACVWAVLSGGSSGQAVAADATGNIYVTGSFSRTAQFITSAPGAMSVTTTALSAIGLNAIYLARFDASTGACRWAVGGGGSLYAAGLALATDAVGNVGLAGYADDGVRFSRAAAGVSPVPYITPTTVNGKMFVARFAPSGACLWVVQPGSTYAHEATALALDAAGNAYLTGFFSYTADFTSSAPGVAPVTTITLAGGSTKEVFVARFAAATGACQWARHPESQYSDGLSYDVAVNAAGTPYLTGRYFGDLSFGTDYPVSSPGEGVFIESLDPVSGAWQAPAQALSGSSTMGNSIATDAAGDQYVTASLRGSMTLGTAVLVSAGGSDLILAKRSGQTGAWLWAVRVGGPGNEIGNRVVVDGSGGVYVGGAIYNSTNNNVVTVVSSVPGVLPVIRTTLVLPYASLGGISNDSDILLARFDARTGACTWGTVAGNTGDDNASDIVADGAGHLFLTGTISGGATFFTSAVGAPPTTITPVVAVGQRDVVVASFQAATGACNWAVAAGSPIDDAGVRLACDARGRVTVTGYFRTTASFVTSAPGSSPVTTSTVTSAGGYDAFVARFDGSTGACAWVTRAGGSGGDGAIGVAVDAAGQVFVSGTFAGSAAFVTSVPGILPVTYASLTAIGPSDLFLARLDGTTGACAQVVRVGGSGNEIFSGMALDGAGMLFLAGNFAPAISFITSAPGTSPPAALLTLSSAGLSDIFLARFAPGTLACTGAWAYGGPYNDTSRDLTINANGMVYTTGFFDTSATFGPVVLAGASSSGFISDFTGAAITAIAAPAARARPLLAYPNPAQGTVRATVPPGGASSFLLLDNVGRVVQAWPLRRAEAGTEVLLPLGSVPPGLYTLRCGPATTRLAVE